MIVPFVIVTSLHLTVHLRKKLTRFWVGNQKYVIFSRIKRIQGIEESFRRHGREEDALVLVKEARLTLG